DRKRSVRGLALGVLPWLGGQQVALQRRGDLAPRQARAGRQRRAGPEGLADQAAKQAPVAAPVGSGERAGQTIGHDREQVRRRRGCEARGATAPSGTTGSRSGGVVVSIRALGAVKRPILPPGTARPGSCTPPRRGLPPKGLSGMIRRAAFRYSENDLRHWLML